MKKYLIPTLFFAAILLLSSGCNKDNGDEQQTVQVNFIFNHLVGNEQVQFDEVQYQNAAGNTYSVETLKYFVSDITLYATDGSGVQFEAEHYVDARDNSTLTFKPGVGIPLNNYNRISFIFGLDEHKNEAGKFPNPPESNMEWPPAMGTGYHYMKLEGKFDSTGTVKNYQAHTGPSMGNQYYFEVILEQDPVSCDCETVDVQFNMDINKWWENPNTLDLNDMSMVMGNQDMQKKLQENGDNIFTLKISK
jgi:hypothetical protein